MTIYAVLRTFIGGPVEGRSSATFPLPPLSPGPLSIHASAVLPALRPPRPRPRPRARLDDITFDPDPVPQTVAAACELLQGDRVVAGGPGLVTFQVPALSSSYSVRITNGSRREGSVAAEVSYPSQRMIVDQRIPLSLFRRKFEEFVSSRSEPPVRVRIDGHTLSVTPASDLAAFGVVPFDKDLGHLEGPIDSDITIHDLNSKALEVDAVIVDRAGPVGPETVAITADIVFETQGVEIALNNLPDVDLERFAIHAELALIKTSFGGRGLVGLRPSVRVDVKATIAYAPDGVAQSRVQETVEEKVGEALDAFAYSQHLAESLTRWLVGPGADVRDVLVEGSDLVIRYLEPDPASLIEPFPEAPQPPLDPGNLSKIDHIVVLMMENRSFDHVLGHLRLAGRLDVNGLRGDERNVYKGQTFQPFVLGGTRFEHGPCHDYACVLNQVAGDMGGFVADFAARYEQHGVSPGNVMGYHTGEQLPVSAALAAEFGICDRWFSAHPGPTFPNRFYTMTGRLNRDAFGRFELDNPDLDVFVPIREKTLFDHLEARGVSHRYYEHGYCFLRLFRRYLLDEERVLPATRFFEDAAAGRLPSVTFLDPDFVDLPPGSDDHPPADMQNGQNLLGRVVNALMQGPLWSRTLLLITYDEHGGFYDHVKPDAAVDVCGVDEYGPRVPTFVISPWVPRGHVSSTTFDHTSIAKTIIRRFCAAAPPDMGARVAQASDVGAMLSLAEPREDRPRIHVPAPADAVATVAPADAAPAATARLAAPAGKRDFHGLLRSVRGRFAPLAAIARPR
jgi:phospholipase C